MLNDLYNLEREFQYLKTDFVPLNKFILIKLYEKLQVVISETKYTMEQFNKNNLIDMPMDINLLKNQYYFWNDGPSDIILLLSLIMVI